MFDGYRQWTWLWLGYAYTRRLTQVRHELTIRYPGLGLERAMARSRFSAD